MTLNIIYTKGLPGSGKSSWARDLADRFPGQYVLVSKDELRAMLRQGKHSKSKEQLVCTIRDHIIVEALTAGKHVIVHDTNFYQAHVDRFHSLANEMAIALDKPVQVVCQNFCDVPVEVCIERDARRSESVGAAVIRKMYRDYLDPRGCPERVPYDPMLPDAVIVDVDGTLAHMVKGGRTPYEWHRVGEDVPDPAVIDLVKRLQHTASIIIVSGRDGSCEDATRQWLLANQVPYHRFYMRPAGDNRKDFEIKREIYERHIQGRYNVVGVLDDRDQVVKQCWRALGLLCLQVAEGAF